MKTRRAGAALVLTGAAVAQIGCSLILDLKDRTDTWGGGGAGGGGSPPACVPHESNAPVADVCGIFVSSSLGADKAGSGSKAHPFKTLAAATVAAGKAKLPVFACAETFTEPVKIASEVAIFGGLDCTKAWAYDATTKSKLTALSDQIPLTLSQTATSVQIFDFTIQAADAMLDGGSSIAVIAVQMTASCTRCDLISGDAKKGRDGTTPTENVGPTISGNDPLIRGNNGVDACASTTQSLGGDPKDNQLCPAANGGPLGGNGGYGAVPSGGAGSAYPESEQTALGGSGQTFDPSWTCIVAGGANGHKGQNAADGGGAVGMFALGKLDAHGLTGASGMTGFDAKPGQGGGGGGGAKGKAGCAGASGGGGGAGGCGGHGGTGGKAGGASIALVSLGATLVLDAVTIALGTGGAGGGGGDGQFGGLGGYAGTPGLGNSGTLSGCQGGNGGPGGIGGKGGGGRGGHAIGIAVNLGATPDIKGVTFTNPGTPGPGGKGGPMNDGDPGVQANVQLFP